MDPYNQQGNVEPETVETNLYRENPYYKKKETDYKPNQNLYYQPNQNLYYQPNQQRDYELQDLNGNDEGPIFGVDYNPNLEKPTQFDSHDKEPLLNPKNPNQILNQNPNQNPNLFVTEKEDKKISRTSIFETENSTPFETPKQNEQNSTKTTFESENQYQQPPPKTNNLFLDQTFEQNLIQNQRQFKQPREPCFRKTSGGCFCGFRIFGIPLFSCGFWSFGIFSFGFASLGIISIGFGSLGVFSVAQFTAGVCAVGQFALGTMFGLGQFATGYYVFWAQSSTSTKYGKNNNTDSGNNIVGFSGAIVVWIILTLVFLFLFGLCGRRILRSASYRRK